jgi:iron(III) transport system substrate-binding protein
MAGCVLSLSCVGCSESPEPRVTLIGTVDEESATPILKAFERTTGQKVKVEAKLKALSVENAFHDTSVQTSSTCDVVWNANFLSTVRLAQQGYLVARAWPVQRRAAFGGISSDATWCALAGTARILLVNDQAFLAPETDPRSVLELADQTWQGRCAVASPTQGNAALHIAVLAQRSGRDFTLQWLKQIQQSALVLSSEREVARAVATGRVVWGLVDSTEALDVMRDHAALRIVFPDQQPSEPGTLLLPMTVAVLASAPDPVSAGMLADYLVSPATEERLAMGPESPVPLSPNVKFPSQIIGSAPIRWMQVDFDSVTKEFEAWMPEVRALLIQ